LSWDALLFDFDGVLADTERIHHRSWNLALEPTGIQWDWEYYQKHCIGVADALLLDRYDIPDRAYFIDRKQHIFQAELEKSRPVPEETLDLIPKLPALFPLAVVSSSFRRDVEPPLIRAGLRPHFQTLVTAEDVRNLKPAPEPYLLGAERLRAKRPLVIEDSDSGVASAKAAGFEVLRVTGVETVARELREYLGPAYLRFDSRS
jgi:HAD superfamily hydrolase (TIGR01509 family)